MKRLFVLLGALLTLFATTQAQADGLLNAVAYRPLPDGQAISVVSLDDSAEALAVKQAFEDALRERGRRVADDAPLRLTFKVRHEIGALARGERRTILEVEKRQGTPGDEQTQARVNLYDTGRGGMLNKGPGTGEAQRTTLRIDVNIADRTEGRRLWQAWAKAELGQGDGTGVARRMVPALVGRLGETARQEPFTAE
jgi:hypothetical protein